MDASNPWAEFFAHARTQPMTLAELAAIFDCNRHHVRDVVLPALDARQIGARWQLKVADMPVRYWIDCGLVESIGRNWHINKTATSASPDAA